MRGGSGSGITGCSPTSCSWSCAVRRSSEIPSLHAAAATWYAEQGEPIEAIRHAQMAGQWSVAARLLADHWFGLYLDGRTTTAHDLLTGFPAGAVGADAELAALMASTS